MTKSFILCLMLILLFAVDGSSQTKRKRLNKNKTAIAYYESWEGGNAVGEYNLKVNGETIAFTWFRESTQMRNIYNNPNATKVGAEWRIVYEPCNDEGVCPRLVSATFTGRNLSESGQTSRNNARPTSGQKQFKVFSECICSCTAKSISFLYGEDFSKDLRIDVAIGGSCDEPSVGFKKGGTEKDYIYYRVPTERFVDKKSKKRVNATLKKLLLDVYNLAVYCEDNNITSSTFSETEKFKVLASLRQYLQL